MKTVEIILIAMLITVIVTTIVIAIFQRKSDDGHSPAPPIPAGKNVSIYSFVDPAEFYTSTSGGTRNVDGSTSSEKGFDTAEDLARYPLTYAAGHPFYKPGSAGALLGGSWSAAVARYYQAQRVSTPPSFGRVLLIENKNTDKQSAFDMAYPVILDSDLAVEGVVVRHGGVLLVTGNVKLRTMFVLVESGGLFQVGYNGEEGNYRFDGSFELDLVGGDPNSGESYSYADMKYPASQYSYEVYAPGTSIDCKIGDQPAFTPFTGMTGMWTNSFGPKCVCGGFNGNLHFAGAAGPLVPYSGTWDVREASTKNRWLPDHPLSAGSPELSSSYHPLWGRLAEGSYPKGSTTLRLDRRDFGTDAEALSSIWKSGAQLLVTNCAPQFNSQEDPTGLLPLWLDHPAGTKNNADNANANNSYFAGKPSANFGIEVCEVADVDSSNGTVVVNLRRPLMFQHDSVVQGMTRNNDKIEVECFLHVALLTRNIRIIGVTGNGDDAGCNVEWKPQTSAAWMPKRANRESADVLKTSGMSSHMLVMSDAAASSTSPQGGIVCNSSGSSIDPKTDISKACYDMSKQPPDPTEFCGTEKIPPGSSLKGSWVYGTADQSQCNSLLGGQCFFRYGFAVALDAVELKTMGIAANFGTIAQYAVHFHLTGYGRSFTGYLRDKKYPRELNVSNCSNWLAFSRWFTLHGTMEARISNNVGFLCFGSGYFVEDGTEILNVTEHNMAVYTQPAVPTPYLNTIPIMANVSSDYGAMSAFWMKNASNTFARNVGCCSPAPVAMVWNVPQPIALLRGPSAPVLGSKKLQLPALCPGATGNGVAGNSQHAWTSQAETGNAGGAVMNTCADKADSFAGCFFPEGFTFPLVGSGCPQYNTENSEIAPRGFAENVAYSIYMYYSEFPEQIGTYGVNKYSTFSSPYMGPGFEIALAGKPAALWMPYNGQNACTDRIISIYPEPLWQAALDEQPVPDNGSAYGCSTWSQVATARLLPKIMTGVLCFCLGPFQDNNGGAIWMHEDHPWLLNCAFVDPTDRQPQPPGLVSTHGYSNSDYKTLVTLKTSTKVQTTVNTEVGAPDQSGGACYPVFRNLITNGNVFCPQSPVLWLGDKTFISDEAVWGITGGEYSAAKNKSYNYFCDFGDRIPTEIFRKISIDPGFRKLFSQADHATLMSFIDLGHPADDGSCSVYILDVKSGSSCLALANQRYKPPPTSDKTFTKYPYICGDVSGLRSLSSGRGLAANFIASQFNTSDSQTIGEKICTQLFKIYPFMGKDGGVDALVPGNCKSPAPAWSAAPQGPWTIAKPC